eukprot:SAG31_NODE_11887_length_988_cov_2.147357_2_plen_72_part_00
MSRSLSPGSHAGELPPAHPPNEDVRYYGVKGSNVRRALGLPSVVTGIGGEAYDPIRRYALDNLTRSTPPQQ